MHLNQIHFHLPVNVNLHMNYLFGPLFFHCRHLTFSGLWFIASSSFQSASLKTFLVTVCLHFACQSVRLESLFGSLKSQAHGNCSAGNYGSSLGPVQVRHELNLTSRALSHDQMFYRDEEALMSRPTHMSNAAASSHHLPNYLPISAHYVPYGFNGVKEFIFPLHIS